MDRAKPITPDYTSSMKCVRDPLSPRLGAVFQPSRQLKLPQSLAHSLSPTGMEKESGKQAKLMGWDEHSFAGQKRQWEKNNNDDKRIEKTSGAQCYCSLPADQSPSSSPVLLFNMMPYGVQCPFGQFGSLSQLCPLVAPCAPQPPRWQGMRSWKVLDFMQALPSNSWNLSVLWTLFSFQIQHTALFQLLGRKLTLSLPIQGLWEAGCCSHSESTGRKKAYDCTVVV